MRLRTLAFIGGNEPAVLISADVLWWGTDTTARVRQEISGRFGVPMESILLHATHNHSGPQTSYRFVPLLGEPDPDYIDGLCTAAVESAGLALRSVRPVAMERMAGRADIAVDRRSARSDASVPATPVDAEVIVVRFSTGGRTRALLVHYACHPVVHHDNVVTSDFTGAAMDEVEHRHPGAVAMYLQGCCGDVNPDLYEAGAFRDGDQATVDQIGRRLADAVSSALTGPSSSLSFAAPSGASWVVDLPLAEVPTTSRLRTQATEPGVLGEWARLLLDRPERRTPTVPVRLSRLRLADGLTLLGMSGEPVSAFGQQVKADSGGAILPMGYTNGMTGYLVTTQQLEQGGYEPAEAPYYFGMPSPLAPEAEPILRAALRHAVSI